MESQFFVGIKSISTLKASRSMFYFGVFSIKTRKLKGIFNQRDFTDMFFYAF